MRFRSSKEEAVVIQSRNTHTYTYSRATANMADMPRSDRRKDDLVDTISLHDGPTTIPLSMPAILRQNVPGYKARAARSARNTEQAIMSARERRAAGLIPAGEAGSSRNLSGSHSDERRFGKRRQRRWENGEQVHSAFDYRRFQVCLDRC